MHRPEQLLEAIANDLGRQIGAYIQKINVVDEINRRKAQDSLSREKMLQEEQKQLEKKEEQINNQWLPIFSQRQQLCKRVNERLLNQNRICNNLNNSIALKRGEYTAKDNREDSNIYESVAGELIAQANVGRI